jgi:hypothetical protein
LDYNIFSNCTCVDSQYSIFLQIIREVIQGFIPIKEIKNQKSIPKHIQKMICYRNLLWKDIRKPQIRDKYIQTSKKIEYEIARFFHNREFAKFRDSRSRYQYIGAFLKSKNDKIPIFNINENPKFFDEDKAECLAQQFQSVFNTTNFDTSDIILLPTSDRRDRDPDRDFPGSRSRNPGFLGHSG